jgi:hypothetical protein
MAWHYCQMRSYVYGVNHWLGSPAVWYHHNIASASHVESMRQRDSMAHVSTVSVEHYNRRTTRRVLNRINKFSLKEAMGKTQSRRDVYSPGHRSLRSPKTTVGYIRAGSSAVSLNSNVSWCGPRYRVKGLHKEYRTGPVSLHLHQCERSHC